MSTTRLVGVYRADGGLWGELRYLAGHYLRGQSCSLCDITHSPFRRKAAWDAHASRLGIAFDLLHLNELDPRLASFVGDQAPCVVLDAGGDLGILIDDAELTRMHGDVDAFFALLHQRLPGAG
jgi:hypothetical protein